MCKTYYCHAVPQTNKSEFFRDVFRIKTTTQEKASFYLHFHLALVPHGPIPIRFKVYLASFSLKTANNRAEEAKGVENFWDCARLSSKTCSLNVIDHSSQAHLFPLRRKHRI